jgi:hypothetical protein
MGVAPPLLAREIAVTVAVAVVASAVVALAGVEFIDSSNGIHILPQGRRATAPRRQGTARARWRWTESTTAMGGNGQRNGKWTVMDGAELRRWTARRQLDGEEWRDGDLMTMDD